MPRGRRDTNERSIIDALRMAGCDVLQLEDPDHQGVPDLLVKVPRGYLFLMEVKTDKGKLDPDQVRWHATWAPCVCVVRSPEEALTAAGLKAAPIDYGARNVAQAGR